MHEMRIEADYYTRRPSTSRKMCTFRFPLPRSTERAFACAAREDQYSRKIQILIRKNSVQVNIPAESGEMGVLASHVPSIEQLKPGLVEVIEESGGSKQFFCTSTPHIGRDT